MEKNTCELENFKDNIWLTRKARINTSERLNSISKYIKFLNVYYSCFIIAINLFDMYKDEYNFEYLLLAVSIILTISILFLDSQQYLERSEKIKKCYIDLQEMYYNVNNVNLSSIRKEYYNILKDTENHSTYDYYKVLISINKATLEQKIAYWIHSIWDFLIRFFFIALPIVFTFCIFVFNIFK